MNTQAATLITANLPGFNGVASLYRVDPPIERGDERHEFVVVSAISHFVTETYIFPADETGGVLSYHELDGSYRGGTDHSKALRGAGYEVRP